MMQYLRSIQAPMQQGPMKQGQPANIPDPLAQLRDIHLPDAISFWPPAIGWWLLVAVIIILSAWGYWRLKKHFQANHYRKQALHELSTLDRSNEQRYLQALNQLLKRTVLSGKNSFQQEHLEKKSIASLSGHEWLLFLDQTIDSNEFTQGAGKTLAEGPYSSTLANSNIEELHTLATCWIKNHKLTGLTC